MKNSTDQGFDQHYNAQVAVDQASLLIVGESLSNHPNDQAEAEPTLDSIPPEMGTPAAAALDAGYFSAANIALFARRTLLRTSRRDATRITQAGGSVLLRRPHRPPMT
jgi:hypothetical protein